MTMQAQEVDEQVWAGVVAAGCSNVYLGWLSAGRVKQPWVEDEAAFMNRTLDELRATYPAPLPVAITFDQAAALVIAWML